MTSPIRRTRASRNAIVALAVAAAIAEAQVVTQFDLPSQPLADSLRALAGQTSSNILFDRSLVAGLSAPALQAKASPEEALNLLLRGTGLTWRQLDEKTVTIVAPGREEARTEGAATSAVIQREQHFDAEGRQDSSRLRLAQAEQPAAEGANRSGQSGSAQSSSDSVEEVVVTGLKFNYNELQSANKMPMSIKDTPQTVKIITEDMLEYANVKAFADLYKLDAGMHTANALDGYSWSFFRGFPVGFEHSFKVDGFRTLGRVRLDLAPFERVEVIKGSTSTLYGQTAVAGTMNAVSKKPMSTPGGSASLEAGSYSHFRGDVDFYGPLSDDGRLSYRMIGAYLNEDSFIDHAYRKTLVLAPSLQYEFSDRTKALFQVNYQKFDYLPLEGYPPTFRPGDPNDPDDYGSYAFPDVPRSRLGGAPWSNADRTATVARTMLEHSFTNDWMLRGNVQYSKVSGVVNRPRLTAPAEDGSTSVYMYFDDTADQSYAGEVNLFGDVELGGRKHTLFFGIDGVHTNTATNGGYGYVPAEVWGFNILTPDYSVIPATRSLSDFAPGGFVYDAANGGGGYTYFYDVDYTVKTLGLTAQTILRPTDRLTLLLGTRHSKISESGRQGVVDGPFDDGPELNLSDTEATTFQTGVTFEVTPDINAYASYGETFLPKPSFERFGFDPNNPQGRELPPEEGSTKEIGLKGEVGGAQLFWSAAFFQVERNHIAERDPDHPLFRIDRGAQESKGFELDVQGKILPGWDFYFSGAAIDNEYTQGTLAGIPSAFGTKLGVSLFSNYQFQGGALEGFGFGGGVVHKQREAFYVGADAFEDVLDDYTEVDLRAFYERGPWRYQLSATNIFDEKYFSTFQSQWLGCCIFVNPPRQVFGSITRKF
jgi:iron complex outermembrane receptor protein